MARDFFYKIFKTILLSEGWKITHDPYQIRVGSIGYEIDFGAEKLMIPERVLYLAVPEKTWSTFFQEIVIQKAIQRI